MPGNRAALYTIKPTIGIISQQGIVPVSHTCDSVGPMTKSVLDLAHLMDVIVDPTKTSVPQGGFASAMKGSWADIRVGVLDPAEWNYPDFVTKPYEGTTEQMVEYLMPCPVQANSRSYREKNLRVLMPRLGVWPKHSRNMSHCRMGMIWSSMEQIVSAPFGVRWTTSSTLEVSPFD